MAEGLKWRLVLRNLRGPDGRIHRSREPFKPACGKLYPTRAVRPTDKPADCYLCGRE